MHGGIGRSERTQSPVRLGLGTLDVVGHERNQAACDHPRKGKLASLRPALLGGLPSQRASLPKSDTLWKLTYVREPMDIRRTVEN